MSLIEGIAPPADLSQVRPPSPEYEHLVPVMARFADMDEADPERAVLRDRLVAGYLPLARHLAARYRNRGEPLDDLEQVAAVGLMNAVQRFRPEQGSDFLSFAVPTVMGELRRHFRDRTWSMRVPRRLKDVQASLRRAVDELTNDLGRSPRPSELAHRLDLPVEEVIEALKAQESYRSESLDSPSRHDGPDVRDTVGDLDAAFQTAEYRHDLRNALERLPERERTILVLRFFRDMTQTQIAAEVGLSQMHVSRLLSQTLRRVRADLDTDG